MNRQPLESPSTGQPDEPEFEWREGKSYFRGLLVERRRVVVGERELVISALVDAAGLLDSEEYARPFIEQDIAPYGLELWPASIMLGEHVARIQPGAGRPAIELGCGGALVSIAAAFSGWNVIATDYESTALSFARYNARVNEAVIRDIRHLDWRNPPADEKFPLVLGADVLYQRCDHADVLNCIRSLIAARGLALICDPNRAVADGFSGSAAAAGFAVDVTSVSALDGDRKRVEGRIFRLTLGPT